MVNKYKHIDFKRVLASRQLFVVVLTLMATYAVFIAVSSAFPLPYDEQYHFALTQYYSQQISPFITSQPEELAIAGDTTRMGSYLMHYLLSFPLRFVSLFTHDIATQVVILRLINIAFVVAALALFRRFLLRLTGSGMLSNSVIAAVCALPVVSLLAAHINYDNLALLAFAAALVLAQSIILAVKKSQPVSMSLIMAFTTVVLLGSLIKITLLPVAAVLSVFVAIVLVRARTWPEWNMNNKRAGATLIALAVLSGAATGLFVERYIGNIVTYGTPQPDCSDVQPLNVCMQYGPWARNHGLEQAAAVDTSFEGRSVEGYVANIWVPLMIRGLGGVDEQGIVPEIPRPVLMALLVSAVALAAGMLGAAIMYRKNILILAVVSATGLYMLALLQRNYSEFMTLHEIVAVQGRYTVPFIVPMLAIGYMGLALYVKQIRILNQKALRQLRMYAALHPDEAYQRTATYWSAKVYGSRQTDV